MLKIALMNVYSEPFGVKHTGGLITSPLKIQSAHASFEPVAFHPQRKGFQPGYKYIEKLENLGKRYDFAIISSFGTVSKKLADRVTPEEIAKINIPFAVQSHAENDWKSKKLDDHWPWVTHPMFRFWMPIVPDMWPTPPVLEDQIYPYLGHEDHIDIEYSGPKEKILGSTGRMTSTKRLKELAMASGQLRDIGYETRLHADLDGAYFYSKDVLENNVCADIMGGYTQEQVGSIMSALRYHYNVRYFKMKYTFTPRL